MHESATVPNTSKLAHVPCIQVCVPTTPRLALVWLGSLTRHHVPWATCPRCHLLHAPTIAPVTPLLVLPRLRLLVDS